MSRALAVLVSVLALGVAAGCGGDDGGGSGSERYPDDVRKTFLASCTAQPNATDKACECALTKIEGKVPIADFERIDKALGEGKPIPKGQQDTFNGAIESCF